MKVSLLHYTPLEIADLAIGKCWDKPSKDEAHMKERIHRVGNKNKHASTLEHLNYSFDIDAISRGCLQELARHRHASLSVKSTRYTLKELKEEDNPYSYYLVQTGNEYVDGSNEDALYNLQQELQGGTSNDIAKYMLPEAYKTSLVWTVNARALQNFLQLRTSKAALWEIRDLAYAIYEELPDEHKYLFKEFLNERE